MEDKELVILHWGENVYHDEHMFKLRDTNLPLDGKYEDSFFSIWYFKQGKLHNENGPANIGLNGYIGYYINGKSHRLDGPSEIYPDGNHSWHINGYRINNETMENWLSENDIPLDWNIWSNKDKMLFVIHWSSYNG